MWAGPVRLSSHLLRRSGDHIVLSGVLYGSHLWGRRCSRFMSLPSWAVMKCLSCFQSGCSLWELNVSVLSLSVRSEQVVTSDEDCLTGGSVHLLRLSSSDVVVSWFRWCWAVDVLCAADVAAEWSWHPLKTQCIDCKLINTSLLQNTFTGAWTSLCSLTGWTDCTIETGAVWCHTGEFCVMVDLQVWSSAGLNQEEWAWVTWLTANSLIGWFWWCHQVREAAVCSERKNRRRIPVAGLRSALWCGFDWSAVRAQSANISLCFCTWSR